MEKHAKSFWNAAMNASAECKKRNISCMVMDNISHLISKIQWKKYSIYVTMTSYRESEKNNSLRRNRSGVGVDNREVINDVLVHLFNEILRLEEEAIITDKYKDISNNDMHIIEAVGLGGGNMSSIAAKLNITVGSLTTSMNSLVKKGYVKRERSEKDRRVVFIQLTNKGRMAYHHHAEFHRQMTDAVLAELNEDEADVLVKALDGLRRFFRQYHDQ